MIEPRVKIKMKETANGADDHINVKEYRKGRIYNVSESLANVFLTADPPRATRINKREEPEPEETKVIEPEETKEETPEEEEAPPEKKEKDKK